MNFTFKTEPMSHQLEAFETGRSREAYALLMYLGRGKSKTDIDSTAWAATQGLIDGWIVIAPSGVPFNWAHQELPKHWSGPEANIFLWNSKLTKQIDYHIRLLRFINSTQKMPILCINVEALDTDAGWTTVDKLLSTRACKLTIDESSILKSPTSTRTKLCARLAYPAAQRRIMTGIPVSESPLNVYGQFAALYQEKPNTRGLHCPLLGFHSYYQFKHRYGKWTIGYRGTHTYEKQEKDEETNQPIYKNIAELERKVAAHSYVIDKDPNLPPKIIMPPRYFELTSKQKRIYRELSEEFMTELSDGKLLTVPHALTLLLRLQQVSCGYLPRGVAEEGLELLVPEKENPRIKILIGLLNEVSGKVVIWCRFTQDIIQVAKACERLPGETVCYYGGLSSDIRNENLLSFQHNPNVRRFIGSPQAGGRGIDLYMAHHTIYYSNYFSNELRLNSEERVHRHGLDHPVTQTDIAAHDTNDSKIIDCLVYKKDLASIFMKNVKEWLVT